MSDSLAAGAKSGPATLAVRLLGACALGSLLAALLILSGLTVWAGLAAAAASVALVAGSRASSVQGSPRPQLAEVFVDRLFEFCLLAPVAWAWRLSAPRISILALVGLGTAYLASYERARAQSLGYKAVEGLGYRASKAAVLSLAFLSGSPEPWLWGFLALTLAAAVVRGWNVVRQDRRASKPAEQPA